MYCSNKETMCNEIIYRIVYMFYLSIYPYFYLN
uniref:Uncharacterized protein n=1 Tax=Siphoviridae sp. ctiOl67 TaxID=2825622 RepID=A0A8S5QJR4_9CAUD|nr:MAG TPA: hypothetical protein [Siphoviridae sp. ctiOl67]